MQLEVEREIELYNDVTIALLDQNRDEDVHEVETSDSEDDNKSEEIFLISKSKNGFINPVYMKILNYKVIVKENN